MPQLRMYLCKDEQYIDPNKESGNERAFTRGISPLKKANAGRLRHGDSSDNAKSALEDEICGLNSQDSPGDQSTD